MPSWQDVERRSLSRPSFNIEGTGHVFIAEQVNGVTLFVDPQTHDMDASAYFDHSYQSGTQLLRLDTNDLMPRAIECMD